MVKNRQEMSWVRSLALKFENNTINILGFINDFKLCLSHHAAPTPLHRPRLGGKNATSAACMESVSKFNNFKTQFHNLPSTNDVHKLPFHLR